MYKLGSSARFAPIGTLWAGPLLAPLSPCGRGLCRPWALLGRALWAPWALVGLALLGP